MQAELVLDCRNQHGEGVQWNALDQRAWSTDTEGRSLWWYAPGDGDNAHVDMPNRDRTRQFSALTQ